MEGRLRRSRVASTVLTYLAVLGAALIVGFGIGRFVLGEAYLKRSIASPVRRQSALEIAAPRTPAAPPVIPGSPSGSGVNVPSLSAPSSTGSTPESLTTPEEATPPDETAPSAEGQTPNPPPPPSPPPAGGNAAVTKYYLQTGTFLNPTMADQFAADLKRDGFSPQVVARRENDMVVHRVLIGPFPNEGSARSELDRLRQKDYDAFLTTQQ